MVRGEPPTALVELVNPSTPPATLPAIRTPKPAETVVWTGSNRLMAWPGSPGESTGPPTARVELVELVPFLFSCFAGSWWS